MLYKLEHGESRVVRRVSAVTVFRTEGTRTSKKGKFIELNAFKAAGGDPKKSIVVWGNCDGKRCKGVFIPHDQKGVCDMELYHDSGVTEQDDVHKHMEGDENQNGDGGLSRGLAQEAQGAYAATKAKMTSHASALTAERTLSQLSSKKLEDLGLLNISGVTGGGSSSASVSLKGGGLDELKANAEEEEETVLLKTGHSADDAWMAAIEKDSQGADLLSILGEDS